ncbi:hypothetical protein ABIG06_003145 [Bradyrhizobium sp. USDA 326]
MTCTDPELSCVHGRDMTRITAGSPANPRPTQSSSFCSTWTMSSAPMTGQGAPPTWQRLRERPAKPSTRRSGQRIRTARRFRRARGRRLSARLWRTHRLSPLARGVGGGTAPLTAGRSRDAGNRRQLAQVRQCCRPDQQHHAGRRPHRHAAAGAASAVRLPNLRLGPVQGGQAGTGLLSPLPVGTRREAGSRPVRRRPSGQRWRRDRRGCSRITTRPRRLSGKLWRRTACLSTESAFSRFVTPGDTPQNAPPLPPSAPAHSPRSAAGRSGSGCESDNPTAASSGSARRP